MMNPDWGDEEPTLEVVGDGHRHVLSRPADPRTPEQRMVDENHEAFTEWYDHPEREGTEPVVPHFSAPLWRGGPTFNQYFNREPEPIAPPSPLLATAALDRLGARPFDSYDAGARRPWAIEDVYPTGARALIAGEDKDMKSTIMLELALSLATATPLFGLDEFATNAEPVPVLYMQSEVDEVEQQYRYEQTCKARGVTSASNLYRVGREVAVDFDFSALPYESPGREVRTRIEQAIERRGFRYLFIDPLYAMIGTADVQGRSGQVIEILNWLDSLQAKLGCTPVITHFIQQGKARSVRSLAGDPYFRYWLEGALLLRRNGTTLALTRVAERHGYGTKGFRINGEGIGSWSMATPKTDENNAAHAQKQTRQQNIDKLAADLIAHPESTHAERATRTGLGQRTVERLYKVSQDQLT
jgi:hypothetical protein